MNYWEECIRQAFDDSGINATDEQIQNVAECVEGAHENYGVATGEDITNANFTPDDRRKLDELKKDLEKQRVWRMATKPCAFCHATGLVAGGLGWDIGCWNCHGEGRT